jgi:hypothetical protein
MAGNSDNHLEVGNLGSPVSDWGNHANEVAAARARQTQRPIQTRPRATQEANNQQQKSGEGSSEVAAESTEQAARAVENTPTANLGAGSANPGTQRGVCPECHRRHLPPHVDNYAGNRRQEHQAAPANPQRQTQEAPRGRSQRGQGPRLTVVLPNARAARAFGEAVRGVRDRSRSPPK